MITRSRQRERRIQSGPLINIETMSVSSDDDIRKISQQLNTLLVGSRRAKGSVI
jgi:hypothetical protein